MSTRTQQQAAQRAAARATAQQEEARQQRQVRVVVAAVSLAVAAGVVGLVVAQGGASSSPTGPSAGRLLTGPPPWPAQADGLAERVSGLGFPPVGDESYHAHVLLSVYRDGQQVPVPANLGFDARGAHSSLHTHTPDGVIHMEADDPYPYELSHVFTTWGVAFDENRLGGDVATGGEQVHVYVNGQPAPDGPVVLEDGDNIVVAYGTEDSFPKQPPADALQGA